LASSRKRWLPFSTEWQNTPGGSTTAPGCSFAPLTRAFAARAFRSYLGLWRTSNVNVGAGPPNRRKCPTLRGKEGGVREFGL
jgi:hypothetical protein